MKIRIFAIGKIKEKYLKEGIEEYILRIRPYCNVEIIEVNDEPVSDNPNSFDIEKAKNSEGQRVIKLLKQNVIGSSWQWFSLKVKHFVYNGCQIFDSR